MLLSGNAPRKDTRIDLRLSRPAQVVLQRAAAARHRTVSEFVLNSGLTTAAETLSEGRDLLSDDSQWQTFVAVLDGPDKPRSKPQLSLACAFYENYDFGPSPTDSYHLYLLVKGIQRLVR